MHSSPAKSLKRPQDPSLPVIREDRNSFHFPDAPPVPPRASNRPASKLFPLRVPPKLDVDGSPPAYSKFDSTGVEGPHGEKLSDVRNNRHIAKRGGWKKLCALALVVILCIVALVVGLFIGLRKKSSSNSASQQNGGASGNVGGPPNPTANAKFPAGSYRLNTYLSTTTTNCTSNAATWMCYPYSTYAQSQSASATEFDWIITPVPGSTTYSISSTPNPFSIMFENAPLTLVKIGTSQEHYIFSISMTKETMPAAQLSTQNIAATCEFKDTVFQAFLYTKLPKTYPSNSSSVDDTGPFVPWPFAVKVEQISTSQSGNPSCTDASGNSLGDFSISGVGEVCQCLYQNTGT